MSKIYAIFTTVVKYFILACGISLLLFFFYDNELELTRDNIKCFQGEQRKKYLNFYHFRMSRLSAMIATAEALRLLQRVFVNCPIIQSS